MADDVDDNEPTDEELAELDRIAGLERASSVPAAPDNEFLVQDVAGYIRVKGQGLGVAITKDQAMNLAAWLAVTADPDGIEFDAVLNTVRASEGV